MKKYLLFFWAMPLIFGLAFSAHALSIPSQPINPIDPSKVVPAEPIQVIPIDTSKVIFDPIIAPKLPIATSSNPSIEPSVVLPLQPIPLPDIVIPPEFFQGPAITNVQMGSDGEMLLVQWKTDKKATSKVEYGNSSTYSKALEDKELVTDHAMAVPASPGTLHLQISSKDSLNKETKTDDLVIVIPESSETAAGSAMDEEAPDTDDALDTTRDEALEEDALMGDETTEDTELPARVPTRQEADIENTATPVASPITATNAALGGLALLLAGILIGVLVRQAKKEKED